MKNQKKDQSSYFLDLKKRIKIPSDVIPLMEKSITIKNDVIPLGIYKLIQSIECLKHYSKGSTQFANWTIDDIKKYFNVNGYMLDILDQLETELEIYKNLNN